MGMTIEDIIQGLKETYMICCSVFAYDRKKYIDGAIDRLHKYQKMQADQVTMLEEILKNFEDVELYINTFGDEFAPRRPKELKKDFDNIIQEKIDKLKENAVRSVEE